MAILSCVDGFARKEPISVPPCYYFVDMNGYVCLVRDGDLDLVLVVSRVAGHC